MNLAWLLELFARHDRRQVEDLIATFLLTIGFDPKSTPPVLRGVIDAFAARAGVEAGEDRATSEAKIQAYLEAHPLEPKLRIAFEQGVRESLASNDTGALTGAFARFAAEDPAKRAPTKERPEGTRPGYLALLAHDDVE